MQTYIETLRKKPESYKKNLLYGIVGFVFILLFLGWLSSLSTKQDEKSESDSGPFSLITHSFSEIWQNTKDGSYLKDKNSYEDTVEKTNIKSDEIPFGRSVNLQQGSTILSNEGVN